ncbi:MAG: UDP-2,3-diacylglucosamine diphosphatase LpxI [Gemmataceae bacterium]|nr:UDP-2,3-diacylglucosamine diphosphatase LpxI [Gemmata sp.]MDW8198036.1 UDP-2,3-diacylglucosamine diphosphatase LpxI [Gemmataceae bacterium]
MTPGLMPLGATAPLVGTSREPVGLVACAGRFPVVFAEKARACGIPVLGMGFVGMTDPQLKEVCWRFVELHRFALGRVIRTFRRAGVKRWTMAGKFEKRLLFRPGWWWRLWPDWHFLRLWLFRPRPANNDDTLLLGLIEEFRRYGLECVSALALCPELLVKEGHLTHRRPTPSEQRDIAFGWHLAREMGRLDVGQSVMVRNRAVLAVEAIEGTDQAIRRAGELCRRGGFVVVKIAKPHQDQRFDVPTVGPQTIETMHAAGATALAIEAGRTILLDEAATIALANRYGIAITSLVDPILERSSVG